MVNSKRAYESDNADSDESPFLLTESPSKRMRASSPPAQELNSDDVFEIERLSDTEASAVPASGMIVQLEFRVEI